MADKELSLEDVADDVLMVYNETLRLKRLVDNLLKHLRGQLSIEVLEKEWREK